MAIQSVNRWVEIGPAFLKDIGIVQTKKYGEFWGPPHDYRPTSAGDHVRNLHFVHAFDGAQAGTRRLSTWYINPVKVVVCVQVMAQDSTVNTSIMDVFLDLHSFQGHPPMCTTRTTVVFAFGTTPAVDPNTPLPLYFTRSDKSPSWRVGQPC